MKRENDERADSIQFSEVKSIRSEIILHSHWRFLLTTYAPIGKPEIFVVQYKTYYINVYLYLQTVY